MAKFIIELEDKVSPNFLEDIIGGNVTGQVHVETYEEPFKVGDTVKINCDNPDNNVHVITEISDYIYKLDNRSACYCKEALTPFKSEKKSYTVDGVHYFDKEKLLNSIGDRYKFHVGDKVINNNKIVGFVERCMVNNAGNPFYEMYLPDGSNHFYSMEDELEEYVEKYEYHKGDTVEYNGEIHTVLCTMYTSDTNEQVLELNNCTEWIFDLSLVKPYTDVDFRPYDKVLFKCGSGHWIPSFYGYNGGGKRHVLINGLTADKVIPYFGNEHLIGTTDNPK